MTAMAVLTPPSRSTRGGRAGALPHLWTFRLALAAASAAVASSDAGHASILSGADKSKVDKLMHENSGLDSLETVGCFNYGYRYHPAMEIPGYTQPFNLRTPMHCQAWCKAVRGCTNFAFWLSTNECWLGSEGSELVMAKSFGAVSGPAECPKQAPACTEIPGFNFPAQSVNATQAAWDSGYQPTNLQCWPRKSSGFPANCSGQMVRILEDTETGWPGQCDGLLATDLDPGQCQISCMYNPLCAVWSVKGEPARCYHGMFGENCYKTSGVKPQRAQRLQHGDFRLLMNAAGIQIMGLVQAFDGYAFTVLKDAEAHCRMVCVSFLLCQYWQYSTVYGCWIEDVRVKRIPYPLVNDGINLKTDSPGAKTVTAGEFIQHTCKIGQPVPLPTDQPTVTVTSITTTTKSPPVPVPAPVVPVPAPPNVDGIYTTTPILKGQSPAQVQVTQTGSLKAGDRVRLTYREQDGTDVTEDATLRRVGPPNALEFMLPLHRNFPTRSGVAITSAPSPPCFDLPVPTDADCGYYRDSPSYCDTQDDDDFTARDMCCSCGGGSSVAPTPQPTSAPTQAPPSPTVVLRTGNTNNNQELLTLALLSLFVLICVGCIIIAWYCAVIKHDLKQGRDVAWKESLESADQSYSPEMPTQVIPPEAYPGAAVPTQVMPQPGYDYPPGPQTPFIGQGQYPVGGPIGGENQYYGGVPTQYAYPY